VEITNVQVNASFKDDISDGHQKAEVVRAKQDMLNRIIQMEEKVWCDISIMHLLHHLPVKILNFK